MALRRLVERAVTKQDYFHQVHAAEPHVEDPTRSYYYDLRARVQYAGAFEGALPIVDYGSASFSNPIHVAQYGLGHLQRYWDSQEEAWLQKAIEVARGLVAIGVAEGPSLVWRYPLEVRGARNWLSAMAQGQVASFLLRTGTLTSDRPLIEAARGALAPFFMDLSEGGVSTTLDGHLWLEEYAFEPIPYTLNGYIVALLGLYDATKLLEPEGGPYRSLLEQGLNTLEQVLPRFDAGGWSRYDLSSRTVAGLTVRNLASPFYHRFHLELLDIMARLTGRAIYGEVRAKWSQPLKRGTTLFTATGEKIVYRALAGAPFSKIRTGASLNVEPGSEPSRPGITP